MSCSGTCGWFSSFMWLLQVLRMRLPSLTACMLLLGPVLLLLIGCLVPVLLLLLLPIPGHLLVSSRIPVVLRLAVPLVLVCTGVPRLRLSSRFSLALRVLASTLLLMDRRMACSIAGDSRLQLL